MNDLRSWAKVADAVFGDDPELHGSFSRIVGRNHHNTILPGLRRSAADEGEWLEAIPYLLRAGFTPVRIAAADFVFQYLHRDHHPMPMLNPGSLCLVDLPILCRGAKRIAVVALGGLQNILDGASLLASLRGDGRTRVFCTADCEELLDGFDVQCADPDRFAVDKAYRESLERCITAFAPELAVNLDPERGLGGDILIHMAVPAGAIAYEHPECAQDEAQIKMADGAYSCLIQRAAGTAGILAALDLKVTPPALWPPLTTQEDAKAVLENLGWDPAKTLAILVDHPMIPKDPEFQAAFAEAMEEGWNFVGMGGEGAYEPLEALLGPLDGRALNLAGVLELAAMAALLQRCGVFLGGTPLLQSMAQACACPPFLGKAQ